MILITGASRGIGNYLMHHFVKDHDAVGFYKNTKPADLIESYYQLDVTSFDEIQKFVDDNKEKLKNIVLINCAGINHNAYLHKSNPDEWAKVIYTNLIGTYNFIRAVLPIMREEGFGRIINFSSVVAQKGVPGTSAYAASKAALWGLAKSVAVENASKGITINNINLGYFDIGMTHELSADIKQSVINQIPSKKFGSPEEIIKAIDFIIKSNYLNGSNININGGIY